MAVPVALIIATTFALAGLELWAFWMLGERDDRRHRPPRPPNTYRPPLPDRDRPVTLPAAYDRQEGGPNGRADR